MGIIFTGSRHSIRPSLNLDFANSKALDPRITFTRASNATYYDGYTSVKAEENLITYSEEIDNASWTKERSSITANTIIAPDGTLTGDKLVENTDTGVHRIYKAISTPFISGQTYTWSVYAKAGERDYLIVQSYDGTFRYNFFDLSNGTVGTTSSGNTSTITDVGNGWYRCSTTRASSASTTGYCTFHVSNADNTTSYTGDGTSGLYLWGAQVEKRDSVTAYTPTTSSPITKYQPALQTAGNNVARFDHNPTTGESLGLLIEEQRTNLCSSSEIFVATQGGSDIDNIAIAPDGTLTADKFQLDTSTGRHRGVITGSISVTAGTQYTYSAYVKVGSLAGSGIISLVEGSGAQWVMANFDPSDNWSFGLTNATSASAVHVGNDWYRISFTHTRQDTGSAQIQIAFNTTKTATSPQGFTGNGYDHVYVWGGQVEVGSFPTSYIKTTGSTVTRSADLPKMLNIDQDDWFKQSKGTWFVNAKTFEPISDRDKRIIHVDTEGQSNRFPDIYIEDDDVRAFFIRQGLSLIANNFISSDTYFKYSVAYEYQNANVAGDGTAETVNTTLTGSTSDLTLIHIGNYNGSAYFLNGYIKKLSYYPLRLTDNEIIDLTEE